MKWIWVGFLTFSCWFCSPDADAASRNTDNRRQKAAAEAKSAKLSKKLKVLKREIKKTERAKENVAGTLAASKVAIAKANRDLRNLSKEQRQTRKHLRTLVSKGGRLASVIARQQHRLAQILRSLHMDGDDQHLKLLLSGDNPNRTNRELQYMSYVTQAQVRLIEDLRGNLQAIEKNRKKTQSSKTKLDTIAKKKRAKKTVLEKEKSRRAALLTKLSRKLVVKRKEAKRLERNQKRMASLVNRLTRLIAKRKRDAAARKRQQLAKRKKSYSKKQKGLVNRVEPVASNDPKDGVFARRRGKLRLPVKGTITERFGSRPEGGGPARKGLFIQTKKGARIKAVATGKVVFADWLRGFGNLVIIDHGSQYMTIYANNQNLYKKVGSAVKAGDVIATAGNSGGHSNSGLYFEMRRRGKAFDPLKWVTIR